MCSNEIGNRGCISAWEILNQDGAMVVAVRLKIASRALIIIQIYQDLITYELILTNTYHGILIRCLHWSNHETFTVYQVKVCWTVVISSRVGTSDYTKKNQGSGDVGFGCLELFKWKFVKYYKVKSSTKVFMIFICVWKKGLINFSLTTKTIKHIIQNSKTTSLEM